MINKLKKKFIALAMVSLVVLLSCIVAGMNIINYNTVVTNADETLEALSKNKGRLPVFFGDGLDDRIHDLYRDDYDDVDAATGDYSGDHANDTSSGIGSGGDSTQSAGGNGGNTSGSGGPGMRGEFGGRGGNAPAWMTRDEAEETRFFTVLADSNGKILGANTSRIFSVDQDEAAEYAAEVLSSGKSSGFVGDLRYSIIEEDNCTRVTFLDCGRTLGSFREFLRASILMSLAGLLVVFGVICFFAGRIVRPVAESYEKQKRFITDAGHEIKTPLTIIKANIDVMRMDMDDALENDLFNGAEDMGEAGENAPENALRGPGPVRQFAEDLGESLRDIDSQVDRLTSLTNDLVYLSRMEEGSGLTMTEVPLSEIVSETADSFRAVAEERNKTISSEIAPLISLQGSTKELEKLVSILMENALKYSPEGDVIKISLKKDGRNAVLEVRNKAITPVSDEDLEHVFERFYRTDKSRNSAAGGHGIGLSMASAIVGAHGGRIRARSGDGSEFVVTATMPAN